MSDIQPTLTLCVFSTLNLCVTVTFGHIAACVSAVSGYNSTHSGGQWHIITPTAVVSGFGGAATAGVEGESSGRVTMWASVHCCYSEDSAHSSCV